MLRSEYGGSTSRSSLVSPRRGVRHYHRVAPVSEVDESLFGFSTSSNRDAAGKNNNGIGETLLEKEAAERHRWRKKNDDTKKQTVQVVTRDFVRSLIVPEETDTPRALVLRSLDFERIKNSSRFLSEVEQKKEAERLRAVQEEEMNGMETRRNYMKTLDLRRQRNEKTNELQEEEQRKREILTHRAVEQLHEQEDEIKRLNELIHEAKVHAVRDAQVAEKQMIKREFAAEDRRLNQAMERDRRNAIAIEEDIERKRKDERFLGALKIMEQIEENEQEQLLKLERKDMENREMRKHLDELCEEEEQRIRKHRWEQERLREMLNQCNADLHRRRQLSKEQEKLLEQKVLEFQRQKAEREEAFELERARIRIEKDREVSRLRALQERARDVQAERDALRARRAEEQMELEWRRKEALEEKRKTETAALLASARAEQLEQKQHMRAVEAQRDRAEFDRVLRVQEELLKKQRWEDEANLHKRGEFSKGVRFQIQEKNRDRIRERNEFFGEGVKLEEEARQRRLQLEEIKRRKLQELRASGIHEKYVAQVERKINQQQHIAIL